MPIFGIFTSSLGSVSFLIATPDATTTPPPHWPNLKGCKFKPRPDHCDVSLRKALNLNCSSRFSCINEYQLLLGTILRWISVLSRESHKLLSSWHCEDHRCWRYKPLGLRKNVWIHNNKNTRAHLVCWYHQCLFTTLRRARQVQDLTVYIHQHFSETMRCAWLRIDYIWHLFFFIYIYISQFANRCVVQVPNI